MKLLNLLKKQEEQLASDILRNKCRFDGNAHLILGFLQSPVSVMYGYIVVNLISSEFFVRISSDKPSIKPFTKIKTYHYFNNRFEGGTPF